MELKLDIYKTRICREVERTATAKDFELSTGVCEDILSAINIDMFDGGLDALSLDGKSDLIMQTVKNAYPVFIELIKEIFELSDAEAKRIKIADIARIVVDIVKYSISNLANAFGVSEKN
jgi:hypothetical protein